jgi:hypothetical protein
MKLRVNLERSRRLIKNADVVVGSELSSAEELTSLFIQLGRYSDANRLLDMQIPEYEELYGKNSIRLIEPFVNRGRILLANGEYTEAEQVATNANQMALKTLWRSFQPKQRPLRSCSETSTPH